MKNRHILAKNISDIDKNIPDVSDLVASAVLNKLETFTTKCKW